MPSPTKFDAQPSGAGDTTLVPAPGTFGISGANTAFIRVTSLIVTAAANTTLTIKSDSETLDVLNVGPNSPINLSSPTEGIYDANPGQALVATAGGACTISGAYTILGGG